MTLPAAMLPAPGITLGDYPQARARPGGNVARGPAPARRRNGSRAATAHRAEHADSFAGRLKAARTLLASEGLSGRACDLALAVAGEAARNRLGLDPHGGQLRAARALLERRLVEMDTGEGKTLAIALAAATAALGGAPVHVVTANDYLARRDADWLHPFYAALGLTVAAALPGESRDARRAAYAADVTYATARELAFDHLRDRLAMPRGRTALERRARRLAAGTAGSGAALLRGLCVALVDEADTVMIDEARMPLILSAPARQDDATPLLGSLLALARTLEAGRHFTLDAAARRARLTPAGLALLADTPPGGIAGDPRHRADLTCQALAALHLHARDRDYVVRDGAVVIVDETTGRAAPGRAWSRGLHQMVELKEGLAPTGQAETRIQTTLQGFFRGYLHLAGVSGTLAECRREMRAVYGLTTLRVPPRVPARRKTLPPRLFADMDALAAAVIASTRTALAAGRAVLIGSASVAESAQLAAALDAAGLDHARLDARHDAAESEIVRRAGEPGRVTLATSMAGRGTDVAVHRAVLARGGLHVILTQHNASPRIDRQFLGRTARRGEPGSIEVLRAMDTPLFRRHLPAPLLGRLPVLASRWPLAARLAAAWPQWREERAQRAQRIALLREDQSLASALAFSGDRS